MAPLRKYETVHPQVQVRVPPEVKRWLAAQAKRNGSSMAFEASRHLRTAMTAEREAARASLTSAPSQ